MCSMHGLWLAIPFFGTIYSFITVNVIKPIIIGLGGHLSILTLTSPLSIAGSPIPLHNSLLACGNLHGAVLTVLTLPVTYLFGGL